MKRRGVSAFDILLIVLGAFLLYLVVPNLGPVIRAAHAGEGRPGVFIAERVACVQHPGHTACNWQGVFRSDDGKLTRAQVFLYGGGAGLTSGSRTKARDVGRSSQVYRPAGTHEWVVSAILAVAGVLLLLKGGLYRLARSAFPGDRRPASAVPALRRTPEMSPD